MKTIRASSNERKEHALKFKAMLDLSPEIRIQAMKKLRPRNEYLVLFKAISNLDPDPKVQQFAQQLVGKYSLV